MELALRLLPIIGLTFALDCGNVAKVDWPWSTGQNGRIEFTAPQSANGWSIVMIFDKNLASNGLSVWNGNGVSCFGVLCTFTNVSYNSVINRGSFVSLGYQTHFSNLPAPVATSIMFNGIELCETSFTTTTPTISSTTTTTVSTILSTTISTVSTTPSTTTTTTYVPSSAGSCSSRIVENDPDWNEGSAGKFLIYFPATVTSWTVSVTFSSMVTGFTVWEGTNIRCSASNTECSFDNQSYNGNQNAGTVKDIGYLYNFPTNSDPVVTSIKVNGIDICDSDVTSSATSTVSSTTTSESSTTTVTSPTTSIFSSTTATISSSTSTTSVNSGSCVTDQYGFAEALNKSLLFFEAQRSGNLDENSMRITWRKDSALNDKGQNGEDLTGGYYDAGDHVKFGFPGASAITVLAWGGISYKNGYEKAGLMPYLLDAVKWGTDYFIKAHVAPNKLYGQVGNGNLDHGFWGRPEDMTMERPAYFIDAQNPGSELAAETSAALASAAILFKGVDDAYSAELLSHAEQLFDFADTFRGSYSVSIPDAASFYNSWSGYDDELCWAAIWLYKAKGSQAYLDKAISLYDSTDLVSRNAFFSWDDKTPGAQVLLAQLANQQRFIDDAKNICSYYKNYQKSPKGRTHYLQWGSLRYAANAALICLQASEVSGSSDAQDFVGYALGQLEYMLGSTGRSFVAGFGTNPPLRAHHRASSCPLAPASCDWNNFNSPDPNPQILFGALVGGPGELSSDDIPDERNDYIGNEVAMDYNAGFQSLLAGMLQNAC